MALVSYILLAALHSGLQSRFHPEILGVTASTAILVVVLDFIVIKFGCYILNIQVRNFTLYSPNPVYAFPCSVQGAGQVTDLLAYGGYKFVG